MEGPPNPTSLSMLDRLRAAEPDDKDLRRLHDIYFPLIRIWLGRIPGLGAEVEDVAQEVFIVVLREISSFERRREGSFRAWLRQVAVNQVRTYRRRRRRLGVVESDQTDEFLSRLADSTSRLAREWDRDHDRHVFQKLLATVRPDFGQTSWEAFRMFALEGLTAAKVAEELGLSENAVVRAKARILNRLREEAGDLLA